MRTSIILLLALLPVAALTWVGVTEENRHNECHALLVEAVKRAVSEDGTDTDIARVERLEEYCK